jgi:SAM-dependent methyltransferase
LTFLIQGCAEGRITKDIGENIFKIYNKNNIYGCDVRKISNIDFNFDLIDSTCKLPYKDKSFDFIFAFMSLHHIEKYNFLLSETLRVLKNDGFLLIREHDCFDLNFSYFLDIIHALYSLSLSDPIEWVFFILI